MDNGANGDFNHVYEAEPIVVYVININKDSYSNTIRRCDNGKYTPWADDKLNWIAIADEQSKVIAHMPANI